MLYYYLPVAYTVINVLIAGIILLKSKSNLLISRFYGFCVFCLTLLIIAGYLLQQPLESGWHNSFEDLAIFLYSMLPFFFLHFIVIFSRRYDILKEKRTVSFIYIAGLFGYAMMLKGFIPRPFYLNGGIAPAGYIYYAVWMSIFFSIGVALLHTLTDSFSEKGIKSDLFLGSFVTLSLILPGPFAQSFYSVILHRGIEWYFVSSTAGLVVAVYLVFRHKIVISTSTDVINAALAGMTDILIKTDDTLRIQLVRGGVTPLLGYIQSDLVGRSLAEIVDQPSSLEQYRDDVLRGLTSSKTFEMDILRKSGEHLMVDLSVSPIIIDNEHAGFVCLGRDVTEQRLVENSPDAMILYRDGKIVFGNTAAALLLGFKSTEQIVGKSILDFVPSDYHYLLSEEVLLDRKGSGNTIPKVGKFLRNDGTVMEVEITGNPHHYRETLAIQLTIRDISERMRVEKILKRSEAFHRQVIENAAGVPFRLIFGPSIGAGYYSYIGEEIESLLGLSPAEFTEKAFSSLVEETIPLSPDIPSDAAECRSRMKCGELKQYKADLRIRNKRGEVKWLNDSSLPLKDENTGEVIGAYGILMDITERKRTEKVLRESEERFRRLTEATFEGIVIHRDGILLEVNDALCRLYDRTRSELLGKSLLEFTAPESREILVDKISSEYEKAYEAVMVQKDGTRIMVELIGRKGFYNGHEVRISAVRDITERKRAQRLQDAVYGIAQAADESGTLDELFRRVHEIIQKVMPAKNFYIALYDPEDDILSFPYFVDEIDEPSPPMKPGKGLTEYVLRTGRSLLCDVETDTRLRESGEIELVGAQSPVWLGVPLVVDKKTIGVMVVQHYSDPKAYSEAEQQIMEFVSSEVARAIDRKWAEEQLRESEERFRRLVELSPDSIAVHSDGILVFVNTAAVKLMGAKQPGELIGKPIREFVHPDYWGIVDQRVVQMTTLAEDVSLIEEKFIRLDGTVIDVEVAAIPFTFEGKPAVQVVIRNVSERKQLEEQFRQAQKMEGIGTLAGGIAHDFNNVLSIILAYTSFVRQRKPTPEKLAQALETIEKAVQRGAGLVRQLLTFARKTEVQLDYLNLNDVLKEVRNLLQETFPKTITFNLELDDRIPKILADYNQLHQALLNLSVNSRDAMEKGGTLSFVTGTMPGSALHDKFSDAVELLYVRLSVSDTGEGMSAETRKRIFEPFFTTKEKGKGTGLGLAVVYGVIKNHHGFIDVESAVGKGTTFHLYFPVSPEVLDSVELGIEGVQNIPGGDETILLVEDEASLLEFLENLFALKGYTTLIAQDGEEAVNVYRDHQKEIDLVVSDVGLPKMGGYDEYIAIKKFDPNAKIIFASGYIDPDLRNQMLSAGVRDFIQKPYEPDEILRKVREVLDKK